MKCEAQSGTCGYRLFFMVLLKPGGDTILQTVTCTRLLVSLALNDLVPASSVLGMHLWSHEWLEEHPQSVGSLGKRPTTELYISADSQFTKGLTDWEARSNCSWRITKTNLILWENGEVVPITVIVSFGFPKCDARLRFLLDRHQSTGPQIHTVQGEADVLPEVGERCLPVEVKESGGLCRDTELWWGSRNTWEGGRTKYILVAIGKCITHTPIKNDNLIVESQLPVYACQLWPAALEACHTDIISSLITLTGCSYWEADGIEYFTTERPFLCDSTNSGTPSYMYNCTTRTF